MRAIWISMLVLVACSSEGPSTDDAEQAWAGLENADWWGLIGATNQANDTNAPSAVITLDYITACPNGGTVAVTGTYDNTAVATNTTFDLKTDLVRCVNDQGTFDGGVTWTSRVFDGGSVSVTLEGEFNYEAHGEDYGCSVEERSTTDTTMHFAGTICGYNLHDDLNLGY